MRRKRERGQMFFLKITSDLAGGWGALGKKIDWRRRRGGTGKFEEGRRIMTKKKTQSPQQMVRKADSQRPCSHLLVEKRKEGSFKINTLIVSATTNQVCCQSISGADAKSEEKGEKKRGKEAVDVSGDKVRFYTDRSAGGSISAVGRVGKKRTLFRL